MAQGEVDSLEVNYGWTERSTEKGLDTGCSDSLNSGSTDLSIRGHGIAGSQKFTV